MTADAAVAPAKAAAGRRELVAATLGTLVEVFDWTMYAILAPYFADQIFPGSDAATKLLAAYGGFAAGFLVRPVGAWLMGRISDTRGRRLALTLSVTLIAAGSLLIAATPSHGLIGPFAALLVLLARLVQGISMGAEAATAAAYISETVPLARRYRSNAIGASGDYFGNALAFAVLGIMLAAFGEHGLKQGGWRIGFVVAAILGLFALWLRRSIPESPVFNTALPAGPVWPQLKPYLRIFACVFFMTVGSTIAVYYVSVYLPEYAAKAGVISKSAATNEITVALLLLIVVLLASGWLADRFGPVFIIRAGFCYLAVVTMPLMLGLAEGWIPFLPASCLYAAGLGPILGTAGGLGARLLPPEIRAIGLAVPTTLAISLFGGTFPLVAEAMAGHGLLRWIPVYAGVTAIVSACFVFALSEADLHND